MLMLEQEAGRRWCSVALVPVTMEVQGAEHSGRHAVGIAANRLPDGKPAPAAMCLGPACTAWCWFDSQMEEAPGRWMAVSEQAEIDDADDEHGPYLRRGGQLCRPEPPDHSGTWEWIEPVGDGPNRFDEAPRFQRERSRRRGFCGRVPLQSHAMNPEVEGE